MSFKHLVGQVVELTVIREAEFGYFLNNGNEEEDVLLHKNEADRVYAEGETLDVFLYADSNGRIAATAHIPEIVVGKYGWAKVTDCKPGVGLFLNIGIQKEILLGEEDLPSMRSVWPEIGDMLYITLRVNRNYRLYARLATDPVMTELAIKADRSAYNKNVQGYIYRTAKVGSWIITNEGYRGFIHESQRLVEPRLGEKVNGRVIDVKEDGTINVSLIPRKQEALGSDAETILSFLEQRNGAMPYWDKSMPEDITERFSMSKAAFKRALGTLMKAGKVYQESGWTYIKQEQDKE